MTNKLLPRAAVCGFLLAALWALFPPVAVSATLPEQVLRLHVVANSDSPEDQAVKLQVRDAVLARCRALCADAESLEEATLALSLGMDSLRRTAQEALTRAGSAQPVRVQLCDGDFPTRDYPDFSLPAGRYRSLRVTIGEGQGKNWWCVVFPALCLPLAEEQPPAESALLTDSQRELIAHPEKYRVGFKCTELLEELRALLRDQPAADRLSSSSASVPSG